ncbi:MAG TPA: sigma 54-interacting transcriptional regulator [Dissulfurispiraceae bacterium]|nr:sigma 54-interacting transcriptional regulator [Dissulfurispiraceae bacterium]
MPVFEHSVSSLSDIVQNENEPLQKVSNLLKYDPGLYFSLLQYINGSVTKGDITSISQAVSLIGAEGVGNIILQQDHYLDTGYRLFWCFAGVAGGTAALINSRVDIADEDEAFFAGLLPSVGMLLMLKAYPRYNRIMDLLLKTPVDQRVFIEEGLFKTNHIDQLDKNMSSPKIYRDIIDLMLNVFARNGHRERLSETPSKLSVAHKSLQMFRLLETAEAAARSLLFPSIVEAQEKFRELAKVYFQIPENEIEELLAEVLNQFDLACKEFNTEGLSEQCVSDAENSLMQRIIFLTKSETLKKSLEEIYTANSEDRNIFIFGENSVGKRLLAIGLHHRPDDPRNNQPFLSIHCAALWGDTFDKELFGAKGGVFGFEKHKGALELADGGTILLKDIDMMPLLQQDYFAQTVCRDTFYKIGETHQESFNIKFIMTSRKNIIDEAKEGRFSEKLLKALNPVSLYIPPLSERREDIEFIADTIIEKYNLYLNDGALRLGLRESYEMLPFRDNLRDLKRLLFFLSAKHSLKT